MFTDKNVHERDQKQINKHIIKKIHMVLLFDFIVPMAYFFKNWFVIIVPISALKWGVGWNVL